ncbi:gamma carbonic anhydrase family protein [Methylobacterium brachythecii]|uniref:Carbonic anhydrase/acetyltransferase-like protein (Isoleucine patch superfamily) n=1 Tax=Methylobacterium brachythecii TaxID=1176177 RepID=A0A7W6AHU3_9HYPH|nr:gamma carbonic anhydrase family protein [Methylobacterium brachythecii]MBB3903612.1 carbonic anhydrase/acetyltransferase-like protein (isoleucine patch superfamily) [Methylobacterium brachythecii]GLS46922.1 gamma carbonic anhydrase family protein [Methylobacterium brachythecii]
MSVYSLDDVVPVLEDETVWIAPGAHVIGRVRIGAGASIWFGAVVRGDNEEMRIGAGSNIQDGAVLHSDPGFPLTIGEGVTVGHRAIVHGCTVGANSLIGMGATVLNGARIGRNCIVGANALVKEGAEFPDDSLIVGMPAKAVRTLDPASAEGLRSLAERYVARAGQYAKGLALRR